MTDMNMEMSLDETLGVEAVAFLNGTVGHTEPKWVTLKNWRSFTDEEKKFAMDIYRRYKEVEEERDRRDNNLCRDAGDGISDRRNGVVSESPSGDLEDNQHAGETGGSNTSPNPETPDDIVDSAVAMG